MRQQAVAETSIACWYEHVVPTIAKRQNDQVMSVIQHGRDYSLCELMALTKGIDKSSMSRVVNGLRAAHRLEKGTPRKCSVSGITVIPSRLPDGGLFA